MREAEIVREVGRERSKTGRSHGIWIFLACVLTVINLGLLVMGLRWLQSFRQELATSTEEGTVLKAAEKIDQVPATLLLTLETAGWVALAVAGVILLALALREVKRASRAEKMAEFRSYSRNLARAQGRHR